MGQIYNFLGLTQGLLIMIKMILKERGTIIVTLLTPLTVN